MYGPCTFKNFHPAHPLVSLTNSTLAWLLLLFPDDAAVEAEIERLGPHYRCRLQITSASGKIRADSLEGNALDALDRAVSQVKLNMGPHYEAALLA